jgi:anti-sigma B factor antagonist
MRIDKQQRGRELRLEIAGEVTIYSALPLHQAVLASLAEADAIELDLAGVTELDSAGVQQLLLLSREARAAGKRLTISAESPATREVFELFRIDSHFSGATP